MKSIIEEIDGDVFCLLVDESADVSRKEHMAGVLRYVDKLGVIKERLIAVVHVQETSASCLKSNIDNLLKPGQSIGDALNKQSDITKDQHLVRIEDIY